MPTKKLTRTNVDGIDYPESGQVIYWDTSLKGFGLRATPTKKMYIAEARVNGHTCRVRIGRHGTWTLDKARNEARVLLTEMSTGINPNVRKKNKTDKVITLAEAYEEFKQSRPLRPKTIETYDSVMRRCFPDWIDKRITEITKDMIEKRHSEISNKNGPRGKGEAQAHQAMRTVRAIFNYALAKYEGDDGKSILPINPVKRLTQIRAWNKVERRQSVIHAQSLRPWAKAVMALSNDTVRDYLLLLLFTGLRRNEALTLQWKDIDFKLKVLRIPGDRTKNHHEHQLPLSNYVHALLKNRDDKRKDNTVRSIRDEFIFSGSGETGHLVEPKRQIQEVIKESGVQFMSHDLRRTFLSIAESLDVSHYALKRLVNHHDSSDVTGGYIINDVERLREPMQKITSFIMQKTGLKPIRIANSKIVKLQQLKRHTLDAS